MLSWLPYVTGGLVVVVGTYASWNDPIGMWIIGAAAGLWLAALVVTLTSRRRDSSPAQERDSDVSR